MNTTHPWKRIVIAGALALAMLAGSASPSSAFLDKTRFLAHLGVAYFVFHHWVLKPYQDHKFDTGADHRTATIVKGGVALLFAVHEVKVSSKIAHESKDPLLQKLAGGIDNLGGSFASVGQKLKSGTFDPKDINILKTVTGGVQQQAAAGGAVIKDVPVAIPGT